mgnify:CR=1 FL=1
MTCLIFSFQYEVCIANLRYLLLNKIFVCVKESGTGGTLIDGHTNI